MAEEVKKVTLHVYDLTQGLANQLSASLLGKDIEGIWHTGIVVYGHEFYFGGGIQRGPIGKTPYGKPLRVIELGLTEVPAEVFEDYLLEIAPRYTAETYSLLQHNCNNFTDEISHFLVGTGIPDYILHLPQEISSSPIGAILVPMIEQLETTMKSGVPHVPQFSSSSSLVLGQSYPGSQVGQTSNEFSLEPTASQSSPIFPINVPVIPPTANENERELKTSPKPPSATDKDPLSKARAMVQEDITREFTLLMASGRLTANEAAALATRRVMAKHGVGSA